jgi:hypothetical protein
VWGTGTPKDNDDVILFEVRGHGEGVVVYVTLMKSDTL